MISKTFWEYFQILEQPLKATEEETNYDASVVQKLELAPSVVLCVFETNNQCCFIEVNITRHDSCMADTRASLLSLFLCLYLSLHGMALILCPTAYFYAAYRMHEHIEQSPIVFTYGPL